MELTRTDTERDVEDDDGDEQVTEVIDVQELVLHTTPATKTLGVKSTVAKLKPETVKLVMPDGTTL